MRTDTHKHYDKAWPKLNQRQQARALKALKIFIENPSDPRLRLHQLKGHFYPQYSISAGGDLRIHFVQTSQNSVLLTAIGTHAQLYE